MTKTLSRWGDTKRSRGRGTGQTKKAEVARKKGHKLRTLGGKVGGKGREVCPKGKKRFPGTNNLGYGGGNLRGLGSLFNSPVREHGKKTGGTGLGPTRRPGDHCCVEVLVMERNGGSNL